MRALCSAIASSFTRSRIAMLCLPLLLLLHSFYTALRYMYRSSAVGAHTSTIPSHPHQQYHARSQPSIVIYIAYLDPHPPTLSSSSKLFSAPGGLSLIDQIYTFIFPSSLSFTWLRRLFPINSYGWSYTVSSGVRQQDAAAMYIEVVSVCTSERSCRCAGLGSGRWSGDEKRMLYNYDNTNVVRAEIR
ncbi:hypothetical protein CALVIDRAFT_60157 [Calocera viscosa TUFC12733]|uniref:Uncharacterized protein n=1 Tax=Calocera viscosa (strain TUFC12733) TaxID=1330018 RepID=A0A167NJ44_CALVF|nr:hypothetical protein CALVIDRAFT_60157 [Calocera viscosa TUFC12733]